MNNISKTTLLDLKPYLTQYLKDKGVFDEEGTKIALHNSLDYEKNELEKEKKDVEEQEIKVCYLEQKIKELGVKL